MTSGTYSWETWKRMFNSRVFAIPLLYGDNLYVIGGCDQMGKPLPSFEMYEIKKRKWNNLPAMPTARASPAAAVVGDKIIVIGGVGEGQNPVSAVEMFDIKAKKWEQMESLTEALLGLSCVVRDNKIIVCGGMGLDTNPKDTLCAYDIEGNTWKALKVMPTPRYATSSFLINDKLYVCGGRQGKLPNTALECYDFTEDKWEKLPDIPSKRVFAMYAASDKFIFSIGGLKQPATEGFSDACEVFDIEKKEWKIGANMPTKRADFAICILGGKLVCAGGLGGPGKPLETVEVYDWVNDSWTKVKDMPTTHCSCAYIMKDDKLAVIGGLSTTGPSSCTEALSFKLDR